MKRTHGMTELTDSAADPKRPETSPSAGDTLTDAVAGDDLCPICLQLLYRPVRTACNHTTCEDCMANWADVCVSSQMARDGIVDQDLVFLPEEVNTSCPMCRTTTTTIFDNDRQLTLQRLYPKIYVAREADDIAAERMRAASNIETLLIHIGNEHRLVRAYDESKNTHDWKFFLRPSRTDIIQEVQIILHPTFHRPRVVLSCPPYEIRRLGWGQFAIVANVVLKEGYSWVGARRIDRLDEGWERKLILAWNLDFSERGAHGRIRVKVRKERTGDEAEGDAPMEDEGHHQEL
ncbi:hypothetical protein PV08_03248 [Exophiala spinifera]|uniref:Uncharacterized protein n=1 Tax=Exophiala spinifera TaxID=91928 RepID=A0A0D2C5Z3_9EURO|nr:uncharacterized protein PV08_03248 [Exophiala spinifera]KIW18959.1 hypothetical protein PV08_03248 [Exophiala spinifera]